MTTESSVASRIVRRAFLTADVGVDGLRPWDIQVADPRFFGALLSRGSLGLGETYMDGWWNCDDLEEMAFRLVHSGLYKLSCWMPVHFLPLLRDFTVNQQSREKSLRVADRHYAMGNDMFLRFLGGYKNYSCAIFSETGDLDEAQRLKLERVCQLLELRRGDEVLDIGGGWGEFAHYAATRYGCRVVSVNITDEQIGYARDYCRDASVDVRKCDYRDITGQYDKIAVLAMLTHVGPKNYRRFMEIAHRSLKPDGRMLIESVGGHKAHRNCERWIDKYIFPGGVVPCLQQIDSATAGLFRREKTDEFGQFYVMTLRAWYRNFMAAWPLLKLRYGERVRRMFEYFFLTTAGSFRAGYLLHWHILLRRLDEARAIGAPLAAYSPSPVSADALSSPD